METAMAGFTFTRGGYRAAVVYGCACVFAVVDAREGEIKGLVGQHLGNAHAVRRGAGHAVRLGVVALPGHLAHHQRRKERDVMTDGALLRLRRADDHAVAALQDGLAEGTQADRLDAIVIGK